MNAPGPLPFPADGHAPAGHRLGPFELRGVAARGPLGIVYRAWDHELGIAVAIKEYLPQDLARRDAHGQLQPQGSVAVGAFERGRDAFIDETRLLARCDHPSLLRVRQLLRAHGTVYRVMPWCQGWPLADLRREMADPPDEPALRRLLDEVLGALETWHRVGGVHGSVNPAKILLLDDDRALLLGPGLVRRAIGDAAGTAGPAPSRSFLAPEQRAPSVQAPCGPCTDFFALAQVVRYCITGMLPQPDGPAPQPLASVVEGLYFDAPHVRYDERFLRAIDAAASSSTADRPQTATEFRDWLEHGPRRAPGVPAAVPADPVADTAQAEAAPADGETQAPAGVAREVDIPVDVLVDVPAPEADSPIASPAQAEAAKAAAPEEEAVDEATVDLIRRVIESIPERHDAPPHVPPHVPPQLPQQVSQEVSQQAPQQAPQEAARDAAAQRAQSAFAEPILRVEDWAEPPLPPAWPQRRKGTGMRWLLGIVVLAGAAYAAWEWGWPAWQEHLMSREASSAQAPLSPSVAPSAAPSAAAPVAPALTALATPPASAVATAAPPASAPDAVAPASAPTAAPDVAEEPAAPPAPAPRTAASAPAARPAAPPESAVTTVIAGQAAPASGVPETAAPAAAPPARRSNSPDSPRQACGTRTQFALYRCMQQQCASSAWARHEQCVRFKATDRVD